MKKSSENTEKLYQLLDDAGIRYDRFLGIHKEDIPKAGPIIAHFITAEPEMVLPTEFNLTQPAANLAAYKDLEKRRVLKEEKAGKAGKYSLVQYSRHVALLDRNAQEVKYLVQFEVKKFYGKTGVTQVKLWRSSEPEISEFQIKGLKLTSYVFFKILFNNHDCIVTDKLQTDLGAKFWKDRIGKAISIGFPVYYLDLAKKTKIRINSLKELEKMDMKYDIWSDSREGQHKRIAICKSAFWD